MVSACVQGGSQQWDFDYTLNRKTWTVRGENIKCIKNVKALSKALSKIATLRIWSVVLRPCIKTAKFSKIKAKNKQPSHRPTTALPTSVVLTPSSFLFIFSPVLWLPSNLNDFVHLLIAQPFTQGKKSRSWIFEYPCPSRELGRSERCQNLLGPSKGKLIRTLARRKIAKQMKLQLMHWVKLNSEFNSEFV